MTIGGRPIGPGEPCYVIAELSANHNGKLDDALRIIDAAAEAGADAVKLQTYTPDTMTLDVDTEHFRLASGSIWDGTTLYRLYASAHTPWEWHPRLFEHARAAGIEIFSSPFDESAVELLEELGVNAYKVASFELVDLPLLRTIAATKKPMIISTGMGSLAEIDEAVRTVRAEAPELELALLKTNSAYPAPPEEMNLRTIPHLAQAFGVPVGLSDHTLGSACAIAAVALGANIVEKHVCLSRDIPGPDSSFSMEPSEFGAMIQAIRTAEQALGQVSYERTPKQESSAVYRRSIFVSEDVAAGELFSPSNIRVIRPAHGLHPRYYDVVIGMRARTSISRGTPLSWELVSERSDTEG